MKGSVLAVHVGPVKPLGPDGIPSGFVKHPVPGAVPVGLLGLDGDAQADLIHHGGLDKAVYAYGADQYGLWQREFPRHHQRLVPGSFGENLPVTGFNEADVCLGDVFDIGSATVQVSQPRQPCFKLGLYFDDPLMLKAMVRNCRSGWYLRVLKTGAIWAGSNITLVDRPLPEWTILRLNRLSAAKSASELEIKTLARLPLLSDGWRGAIAGLTQATAIIRRA